MNKSVLVILGFLLAFLVACAPAQEAPAEEPAMEEKEKIVLGALLPLSGDAAEYGDPIQAAQLIALEEINAAGGINGKELEIIFEDAKCDSKEATTAAQKLISVDGVKIILGGACSSETLAAASVTEPEKVILLSSVSSSPDVTNAGDFVFRTYPSDAYSASIAAEYASGQGHKTAAIISEQKDYAQALRTVFKESFEKLGGKIVADETYASEDTDFKTHILKIVREKPGVIYVAPQTAAKGLIIVKQLREAGAKQQLIGAELLIGKETAQENAALLEGFIGLEPSFDDSNTKAAALFAKYTEKHGKEPPLPFFMASGYDDVYLIKDAIEAGGTDTEAIRDWLYGVENWDGAIGSLTIDENGDPILKFSIKRVTNGEVVESG